MMNKLSAAPGYRPPYLEPSLASLVTELSRRASSVSFPLNGGTAGIEFHPFHPDGGAAAAPALVFALSAGGHLFQVELSDLSIIAAHPALVGTDAAALPEPLKSAALDIALEPALEALGRLLGVAAPAVTELPADLTEGEALFFTIDSGAASLTEMRVRPMSTEACLWLAEALRAVAPLNRAFAGRSGLRFEVSVIAGWMTLAKSEVDGLGLEDILLPTNYPAAGGRFSLNLPDGREAVVDAAEAVVLEIKEAIVKRDLINGPEEQTADSSTEAAGAGGDMELSVTFELERRIMTLGEIEALAPGVSFPLAVDGRSPVSVRVGGRTIGKARLVDLGGTLGLQITDLSAKP
ncbi:hypothetical protein C4J81_17750 [Deltaproteobacteria bacterium Smac51]|nr:hypothetical protein C4J81_17750 [Deltaproteobacteria bacterium Smac51]